MKKEVTSMLTSASDPVLAPAHYAGDGKIECKRAVVHDEGIRPRRNVLRRILLVRMRVQVPLAMAVEEQERGPDEGARVHRYRAFARQGVIDRERQRASANCGEWQEAEA